MAEAGGEKTNAFFDGMAYKEVMGVAPDLQS
jgi:hypothetical protein